MTTKPPTRRPRTIPGNRRVQQLELQLKRRLRFDILVLAFGVMVGVLIVFYAGMTPPNMTEICNAMGGA